MSLPAPRWRCEHAISTRSGSKSWWRKPNPGLLRLFRGLGSDDDADACVGNCAIANYSQQSYVDAQRFVSAEGSPGVFDRPEHTRLAAQPRCALAVRGLRLNRNAPARAAVEEAACVPGARLSRRRRLY